jgi:hypothetical protein
MTFTKAQKAMANVYGRFEVGDAADAKALRRLVLKLGIAGVADLLGDVVTEVETDCEIEAEDAKLEGNRAHMVRFNRMLNANCNGSAKVVRAIERLARTTGSNAEPFAEVVAGQFSYECRPYKLKK